MEIGRTPAPGIRQYTGVHRNSIKRGRGRSSWWAADPVPHDLAPPAEGDSEQPSAAVEPQVSALRWTELGMPIIQSHRQPGEVAARSFERVVCLKWRRAAALGGAAVATARQPHSPQLHQQLLVLGDALPGLGKQGRQCDRRTAGLAHDPVISGIARSTSAMIWLNAASPAFALAIRYLDQCFLAARNRTTACRFPVRSPDHFCATATGHTVLKMLGELIVSKRYGFLDSPVHSVADNRTSLIAMYTDAIVSRPFSEADSMIESLRPSSMA